jgi:subtilisin family serine protease
MKLAVIFMTVLLLTHGISQAAPLSTITGELANRLTKAEADELIRVNIVMAEQVDWGPLISQASKKEQDERRAFAVKYLQDFAAQSQKEVLEFLQQKIGSWQVQEITTIWSANVVNCSATAEVIQQAAGLPSVRWVDWDQKKYMLPEKPREDGLESLEGAKGIVSNLTLVGAPDVWALGYTGDGVLISVHDTGVNYNHLDLAGHVWDGSPTYPNHGYDFANNDDNPMDDHGHGTHCAGTAAGDGTAGTQTGMAPDATVMCLKVLDATGNGYESDVWESIDFAMDHGVDVMSFSIGWMSTDYPDYYEWRTTMNGAMAAGMISAVAAGNAGDWLSQWIWPVPDNVATPGRVPPPWLHPDQTLTGGLSDVITVGATDGSDNRADFSSIGPATWESVNPWYDYPYDPQMGLLDPDVCAPGVSITSLQHSSNTGYVGGSTWSGTSMSCPHVAGLLALMLSKNPNLTPAQMDSIVETTSLDRGSAGKDNDYGAGRIRALQAVNAVPPGDTQPPTAIDDLITTVSLGDIVLQWSPATDDVGVSHYVVYRKSSPNYSPTPGDSIGESPDKFYVDAGAAGDTLTNYYYHVKAADAAGHKSSDSNEAGEFDRHLISLP